MNPGRDLLAGRVIHRAHREHPHRSPPVAPGDLHDAPLAAVGLEQRELRESPGVVHVGDPLAVRRPAGVEGVVLEEGQLVGRTAVGRLDVEVRELIRRTGGRGINEPLPIDGDIRTGPIEGLFREHRHALFEAVCRHWSPDDVPRAERHLVIGDHQQFPGVGHPGRCDVHVPGAEVEPLLAVALVPGERHLCGAECAVRELTDVDVEVARWLRGHVGEPRPVRRERRIGVKELIVRERTDFPGGQVRDREADGLAVSVHREDDVSPVGRPGGERVVSGAGRQFVGNPRFRIHAPDGAGHRHRDRLPVR